MSNITSTESVQNITRKSVPNHTSGTSKTNPVSLESHSHSQSQSHSEASQLPLSRNSPPNDQTQTTQQGSNIGGYSLSPTETRQDYSRNTIASTPQYDYTYLDSAPLSPFFRSSPKVTPSRNSLPMPNKNSLPSPKYSMNPNIQNPEGDGSRGGVNQILRASASANYEQRPGNPQEEDGVENSSPPRESTQRNGKIPVVSPPEIEAPGRDTAAPGPGYELPSVPDSPYGAPGAYPPYHGQHPPAGYQYPSSPIKSHLAGTEAGGERYPPYHGQYRQYPPPHYPPPLYGGYDRSYYEGEGYRDASSPGKRLRMDETQGKHEGGHEGEDAEGQQHSGYHRPTGRGYHERGGYGYPQQSGSFDNGPEGGSHRRSGPPPVSKAPSYPPPPSPARYGTGADSSAASYPGARRSNEMPHGSGSDQSYNNPSTYSPRAPRFYPPRYEDGHAPPQDYYGRYPDAPPPYLHPSAYGREEHPLASDDENKMVSPQRKSKGCQSGSSKDSPNKTRPSTTAQAAIAAGMTEPASAKEVDFDVTDPPSEPFTPPSTRPVISQSSDISSHDVLCGRGGGTNTQVGNRRFRSLVQEFQPTYLLCRRKEKPLIARTIVLIIRNRGGHFLKKNEDDGTYLDVGDEKAEAKTSQALREGLDVRACRSTIDGKKKTSRIRKKKSVKREDADGRLEEASDIVDSPHTGPPPHHPEGGYAYPPPPYYYGYDPYYPPPYGAPSYNQHPYSPPQRKRARGPPGEASYDHSPYPPPYKGYGYHYPPEHQRGYGAPHGHQDPSREEENVMGWDMDFSPPKSAVKRQADGEL